MACHVGGTEERPGLDGLWSAGQRQHGKGGCAGALFCRALETLVKYWDYFCFLIFLQGVRISLQDSYGGWYLSRNVLGQIWESCFCQLC